MFQHARFLAGAILLATSASLAQAPAEDLSAIKWETNDTGPAIGDPRALRGGTINLYMGSYPLTFRLFGPNSNDAFAGWNRAFSLDFSLVTRHPTTDAFIPMLATHWAVMPDNRTLYFKLDPDARWSDGVPVTADDYVFIKEFFTSPHLQDPFYKSYYETYFEDIIKIDTHTLKIVGKKPSWRPLDVYGIYPVPKHATQLDADWVTRTNNQPPVVVGPYTISNFVAGERVEFTRIANWWGDKKPLFKGMFNPDVINLKVYTDPDRNFDAFVKGDIDVYQYRMSQAKLWFSTVDHEIYEKGWASRREVYFDTPQGLFGMAMNLKDPIFQNKNFRKAIQSLLNFDELNEKVMFKSFYRTVSTFEGTEFASPNAKPYGFNPKAAGAALRAAGYTKRGKDGILVNAKGERASFTITYGAKSFEQHLTVIQNGFKRAGVEMKLELVEPGTSFERMLQKNFQMGLVSMMGGLFPEPHQYFSSEFKDVKDNNNFWGFGTPETDKLIETYRFDMDPEKRKEAMAKLDETIIEEAFYVPFWQSPFIRIGYYNYVEFPENYAPRRTQTVFDSHVWWINPEKKKAVDAARAEGRSLPKDARPTIADPYGVKARLDARAKAPATAPKGAPAKP